MILETNFTQAINFDIENLKKYKKKYIIGIDEVGTGAIAGPIFASAVILKLDTISNCKLKYYTDKKEHLIFPTDSKLLTDYERALILYILNKQIVASGIGMSTVTEINENPLPKCRELAWDRAVNMLFFQKGFLIKKDQCAIISDAFKINYNNIVNVNVTKGDLKSVSVGSASILAKVSRDAYMTNLSQLFPDYCWSHNKGYTSDDQMSAILKKGVTIHHRTTFKNVKEALDKYYNSIAEGKDELKNSTM